MNAGHEEKKAVDEALVQAAMGKGMGIEAARVRLEGTACFLEAEAIFC